MVQKTKLWDYAWSFVQNKQDVTVEVAFLVALKITNRELWFLVSMPVFLLNHYPHIVRRRTKKVAKPIRKHLKEGVDVEVVLSAGRTP